MWSSSHTVNTGSAFLLYEHAGASLDATFVWSSFHTTHIGTSLLDERAGVVGDWPLDRTSIDTAQRNLHVKKKRCLVSENPFHCEPIFALLPLWLLSMDTLNFFPHLQCEHVCVVWDCSFYSVHSGTVLFCPCLSGQERWRGKSWRWIPREIDRRRRELVEGWEACWKVCTSNWRGGESLCSDISGTLNNIANTVSTWCVWGGRAGRKLRTGQHPRFLWLLWHPSNVFWGM